mmetsp:Transcript_8960/g.23442  ORF Transcript_8960/g.23442 Transcript_8960/m.23442 type:complete len:334 (+) Transcript_8960:27-1028(+)
MQQRARSDPRARRRRPDARRPTPRPQIPERDVRTPDRENKKQYVHIKHRRWLHETLRTAFERALPHGVTFKCVDVERAQRSCLCFCSRRSSCVAGAHGPRASCTLADGNGFFFLRLAGQRRHAQAKRSSHTRLAIGLERRWRVWWRGSGEMIERSGAGTTGARSLWHAAVRHGMRRPASAGEGRRRWLVKQAEVLILDRADRKDLRGVHTRRDHAQPDLGVLHHSLRLLVRHLRHVRGQRALSIECHVLRDEVLRDEHLQRPDLCKEAELIDDGDDGVEDLTFERPEDNRVVSHREGGKSATLADPPLADFDHICHSNHKAVLAGAAAFHSMD